MPRRRRPSSPTVKSAYDAAFVAAQEKAQALLEHEKFSAECNSSGVEPQTRTKSYDYWRLFAQFTGNIIARAEQSGVQSTEIDCLRVLSAAPAFLFSNRLFSREHMTTPDALHSRISFNGLLRSFAQKHTDVPVASVTNGAMGFVEGLGLDQRTQENASEYINKMQRGAQSETGFEQVAAAIGRRVERATVEEDALGFDYKIWGDQSSEPHLVDVKSSYGGIEALGEHTRPYVRKPNGILAICLQIKPQDYNGRYFIPGNLVAQKAPVLDMILRSQEIAIPTTLAG
jgi:hypothetical protein